jgi:hypothetical protein
MLKHEALTVVNETLVLQSQIAQLKPPDGRPLLAFRDFINGPKLPGEPVGAMCLIGGRAESFLDDSSDLLTLIRPPEEDLLSRFLEDHWVFRKREAQEPLDRTTMYKNSHVDRTVAALDIILAAILLIGAIVNL